MVLADRMGCLKRAVVANIVVPTPAYVRFATTTASAKRPTRSPRASSALVGYAKLDLVVPRGLVGDLRLANEAAATWCQDVNSRSHSETCAVPRDRLESERPLLGRLPSLRPSFGPVSSRKVDRLSTLRCGSARYSVPTKLVGRAVELQVVGDELKVLHFGEVVASHALVAPGEVSIKDEHYGGARSPPRRAPRPRTVAEKAICALGEVGEAFIKGAAAAGVTRLGAELEELATLEAAHGRDALVAALVKAVEFSRYKAADVRSILAAGQATPRPSPPGGALVLNLPKVPTRSLAEYGTDKGQAS